MAETKESNSEARAKLVAAAHEVVTAIAGSITRGEMLTSCSAASASVIECAMVNIVTTPSIGRTASRQVSTGSHPPMRRRSTAGSSRQIRNRTWS